MPPVFAYMDRNTKIFLTEFERKTLGTNRPEDAPTKHKWSLTGPLNMRDAEVWMLRNKENLSVRDTARRIGCSKRVIQRVQRKQAYRDVTIAAAAEFGYDARVYAKNMVELTKAEKSVNIGGEELVRPENKVRLDANIKLGEVFGVAAPKQFDLQHSMSAMSDDELEAAVDESVENLDGRVQHRLTQTPIAEAVVTAKKPKKKQKKVAKVAKRRRKSSSRTAGA